MDDGSNYTWQSNNKLVKGSIKEQKNDTLLDITALNKALRGINENELKRFPSINWDLKGNFKFSANNKYYEYNFKNNKISVLNQYPENAENIDIEPIFNNIAYTVENNLYVSYRGTEIVVSQEKNKGIVYGQSVHRNEFGINKGTFWSPKGNYLAFYRMDETMVTDYPLVDIDTRIAELRNIKYPMAGMKSHHVTVGVFDPVLQKIVYLKTGEPEEQYLTNITWSPDEKYIYIAVLNRDQNHMKLNKYDVNTGNFISTLFEEKNDKYVEPLHGLFFIPNKNDMFIWMSQRDGFNHLYLYNTEGKLIKQLTKGKWIVKEIEGFDAKGNKVFISATKDSPLDNDIYEVDLNNGNIKSITLIKGNHNVIFDKSCKNIIDVYSNVENAYVADIISVTGKKIKNIIEDKNPLKDYNLGEMRIFTLKAEDGNDLYCRLIKPVNFDSTKKYPVIIYVYGGPHAQLITNSWLGGAGLWLNYLAQEGYIVFTLDNRGSANRGFEFESVIHRNLGKYELNDQMVGVNYLKSLSYVDPNRIAVDGWSFGGFMSISMKLKNPGVFKVATAGGPVIDWKWYEVMYGERYMDTPEQNPDGYKNACLLNYIDKLEGKLLVIHGGVDNTVVPQHSLSFLKKCIEKGKQVDFFLYPTHEHNVRGVARHHLFRKLFDYYKQNL
jgi:dipeptidyl-peptidase-4